MTLAPGVRRAPVTLLLVASVALVGVGQWQQVQPTPLVIAVAIWSAGLALFVWLQWSTLDDAHLPARLTPVPALARWRWVLVAVAAAAAIALWGRARGRPEDAMWTDVTALWLVATVAMVVAAWPSPRRTAPRRHLPSAELILVGTVVAIGAAARFVALDRFPVTEGDGMALTLLGRQVTRGELTDPFSTGYLDNPTLHAFVQSGVMRVLGESLFTARFLSALVGSLTVLATYCWCRRLQGGRVALIAAALLALLPIHLYFSRISLNNVEDPLFLVLVLWLLDRAVVDGRRLDAVLAGVILGLSQYFYFGARILPLITVVVLIWFVPWCRRRGLTWGEALRRVAAAGGWLMVAALLVFLPLAAHYADQPEDLNSRFRQVAFFGPGLEELGARNGSSTFGLIAEQAVEVALLPFSTVTNSPHYHPGPPVIGGPVAVLAALGLAVATAACLRRRHFAVAASWWITLAGIGLTAGLGIQRWALAYPVVAVMAAIGVDAGWRVLRSRLGMPARWVGAICTSVVVAVMAWGALWFFRDENTLEAWSDENTLIAHELAELLAERPAGTVVYTVFAPRMSFTSHATVSVLADHVTGIDVMEPMTASVDVPPITGHTVFALLPERLDELDVVRAAHPGGRIDEVRYRDELLFVTYEVDRAP